MKRIVGSSYLLSFGGVNAVLLDDGRELTLIDAGFPGKTDVVWKALDTLGRRRSDLRHLILTHAHPDHIGGAAEIASQTGARTYIHAADAAIAAHGGPFRPMSPAPGLFNRIGFGMAMRMMNAPVDPVGIDHPLKDGDQLEIAGGLTVIGTPGHCAGQIALLWKPGKLLIAGDVCTNIFGLNDPIGFEDEALGRDSQRRIASLDFDAIAFGHGRPIKAAASRLLRKKWGRISAADKRP